MPRMSKKILVVGLGPSGGILAVHLAEAGHAVFGVDTWEDHLREIMSGGLKITHLMSGCGRLADVSNRVDGLSEKEFDYAVIAVKTPRLTEVVSALKPLAGDFKILVLQNGLDNEYGLADPFRGRCILRAAVNYAGNVVSPGVIRMNFFQKPNQVGCICDDTHCRHAVEIAEILTAAALDTESVADIRRYTWRKTILNAILAPIAALLEISMAEVMAHDASRAMVESLIKESIQVAEAAGYDYGGRFFDQCIAFLLKAGSHKPSMLIDIESGNPTEIDYINGKIAEYGRRFGVPVPFNTMMTSLVKTKDLYNRRN